ncbi:GGDEF domain-containing protein [Aeromonas cavernicola]|uniref:diguanylate cyclase n=1 Tax=Aeromonas cavernicola TaxID=1006623 RepID=A0A2H9U254_9GAMM|nr:sensor domain-containing diguanylate cyclase [Aeromonas cavernicola]PJG58080.1 GGDEF domain-containing protein [Aeromonas cavernicola]
MNHPALQQVLFSSFDAIPIPILVSESMSLVKTSAADMSPRDPLLQRHRFINKAFQLQLGYDLSDVPDIATWFTIVYPDEHYRRSIITAWYSLIECSFAQGDVVAELPALIRCKNGKSRWFIVTIQLVTDAIPDGHIITFRDIHDLKCMMEEVSRLSCTDSLTELSNRRAAEQQLNANLLQGHDFSVVLVDIDHFKQVNDRHGHPAGDRVLCAVAQTMASQLLPGELLARWGGEEFLLILPHNSLEQASQRAEMLRQQVSALTLTWQDKSLSLTISLGCASLAQGQTVENLLMEVDKALYQAKAQGRNQVVVSASQPP